MTQSKKSGIKFMSVWFSPRGFANEGTYLWGHENDILRIIEEHMDDVNCCIDVQSRHYTEDAAQRNAEKLSKRDHRMTPPHELCCIESADASDMVNDIYAREREDRFSQLDQ